MVLERELRVSPLLARLLVNRGLCDPGEAAAFLDASLSRNLRSPMLFREMARAAARLLEAVRSGQRIAIYGDYDVDGITAATELALFLRELGVEPDLYIPHRMKEGYGLNPAAIQALAARGVQLIVTADCGAAAHEEIALAASLGIDVIVCDHHQNPSRRPPAFAVLNPVAADAGFPFAGLSAAGVMFYFLMGARMLLRQTGAAIPDLRRYLDLVALGTVADLVPLLAENRVLVKYGLRELARSARPGMRALLEVCAVDAISVETLGFRLGPRINASGRLADATAAVELLSSRDPDAARRLAAMLDGHNRDRRDIEQVMFEEAEAMIERMADRRERRSFVLASEGWHAGVVGIVASRLVERHYRPVVLLAIEGERARGSARGIPSVDLFGVLRTVDETLERYGGHRLAAGLTMRCDRLAEFTERFEQAIASRTTDEAFVAEIRIDGALDLDALAPETLEDIDRLEPYGQGNQRPLFLAAGVEVVSGRVIGAKHLKLALRGSGGRR
ncbi:MAG: single-stranded-DNA-specific exonuclease RecJ, partial [Candidatus Binatia bacterium]